MTLEDQLLDQLMSFHGDPYGFVLWAFPWGEPGSELEKSEGPEEWQANLLRDVRDGLLTVEEALLFARTSGHGIGKSAMVSWLVLWAFSTMVGTKGVVTANTENQLKTKTWAEVNKWFRLFIAKQFFQITATRLMSRDPEHEDTWRIDMVPWSERNMEAFAGLHNQDKRILVVFDEASAIPDVIWETTEGALTDKPPTQILWFVFGNPTRNNGRFRECFPGGQFAHRWKSATIDSRSVSITNKTQFEKWIADYGEDSDFVRVRVKGEFPRAGLMEFISAEIAKQATLNPLLEMADDPFIMGVDVARFGADSSVIYFRKGFDGRTLPPLKFSGIDTMELAAKVATLAMRYRPDMVFVDETGIGAGVVDRLRQLRVQVIGVNFGARPDGTNADDLTLYANKRAEIWGAMRSWLRTGCIPDEDDLVKQLKAPTYGFNQRNEIQLERKDDMRKRGEPSPDIADALALTFAYPVMPSAASDPRGRPQIETDYDPFSPQHLRFPENV